jgi:phenylalanyl-tRNA synthetase alpha subunit
MRLILEKYTARKEEAAEEKKELTEQLKRVQKAAKKKKEVLQEIDKLGGQDLRVLQGEVNGVKKELEELREQWEEYKKPINDEILGKRQEI